MYYANKRQYGYEHKDKRLGIPVWEQPAIVGSCKEFGCQQYIYPVPYKGKVVTQYAERQNKAYWKGQANYTSPKSSPRQCTHEYQQIPVIQRYKDQ